MKNSESKEELISFIEEIKRQWMSTIDALVDPLMIVKKDYSISKANLAMARIGNETDIKKILGKKCYKVFAGRSKPCPGCKMKESAKAKHVQTFELDEISGNQFYEVTSQPIYDSNNELDGVVQVYRDRTEAKKLREQLLQSEKLSSIGLLAGGVAHEINNPLGGILVFSQMILREMPKDNPHYEDVEEILSATERCKAIVENLLEFARTNPADKKAENENVAATEAAKTALRFGKVSIPQHQIDIVEEWNDDNAQVLGNRNRLIQIFLNLIQNAIQAMPDGGTLTLKSNRMTKNGKPFVEYHIEDSGVGIPEEHRKQIFDPFFTTKEPGEGTGLGLAICYGIVQDLHGELSFTSRTNEGTSFSIQLPIQSEEKKSA